MKRKSYKKIITLLTICFFGTAFAQKFDKKFTENFKVNKDVEISINASNTDINVTTWNKNEVSVEAFIEVEGISKKEAESYFKNWNFEALGNKSTVKITSKGSNSHHSNRDFVFFNNRSNFNFPEVHIETLDSLHFPNIEEIIIPEIDIDYETMFSGLEGLEFDFDKYVENGKEYFFQWKDDAHNITIKSKKEWENFKKTKEYKLLKEKMTISKEKMKKEFEKSREKISKIDKKRIEAELRKAKIKWERFDKVKLQKDLAKAKESIKNIKMEYFFDGNSNDITVNGKKIKITKKLEIKVPKSATFDLNTRHCKVKLPNTKASGKVSYGTFNVNDLNGGKLNIYYTPVVNINDLNACTLFLNNVTDAKIASVTNTTLSTNSSQLNILKINENVELSNKFGALKISKISPNYKSFNLLLDFTEASINTAGITNKLIYNIGEKSPLFPNKAALKFNILDAKTKDLNGNFVIKTKDNTLIIQGKYSQLNIKE